jgi:hypothetical protein
MTIKTQSKRTTFYLKDMEVGYLKKASLTEGKSMSEYLRALIEKDMGRKNEYFLKDLKKLVFAKDKYPWKVDRVIY